jgi:hypothetical protein
MFVDIPGRKRVAPPYDSTIGPIDRSQFCFSWRAHVESLILRKRDASVQSLTEVCRRSGSMAGDLGLVVEGMTRMRSGGDVHWEMYQKRGQSLD